MRFGVMGGMEAMSKNRCYSELIHIPTFEERFEYLKLDGVVGIETFGFDRYLNQRFYHSKEWLIIRDHIISRDLGCDMVMVDREIQGKIYIHHMNPICIKDIELGDPILINPEYLVCMSFDTHNAVHYGSVELLPRNPIIRRPGDTCPWKRG